MGNIKSDHFSRLIMLMVIVFLTLLGWCAVYIKITNTITSNDGEANIKILIMFLLFWVINKKNLFLSI